MAYTDADGVKAYLKIPDSETDDDTLIGSLATGAQKIIEAKLGRVFEAASDSARTFDALADTELDEYGWRRNLVFYGADLCSITSIVNGDGTTIASTKYVTLPKNVTPYYGIRLKASSGYAWEYEDDPEDAITITGKWAYSASAPDDIVHATIRLAAYLYKQKDTQQVFEQVLTSPGGVLRMPSKLPTDVIELLEPYRRLTP
ncbi:MAG: phage gp6-like head-tail connector protein [Anaerolineae bacterium]|nr:phage gp6-like head-tail connector protein [Anaerolineae bacterium]